MPVGEGWTWDAKRRKLAKKCARRCKRKDGWSMRSGGEMAGVNQHLEILYTVLKYVEA
jgi:hypothetical protein